MKPIHVWVLFALAIFAVGSAAPLARLADGIHPISLGFWRVTLVGISMLIWTGVPNISMGSWIRTCIAGICLALHFWVWFESLLWTTVFKSTVLVCLNPIWVGLWKYIVGSPVGRGYWLGVLVSLIGVVAMSVSSEFEFTFNYGDGLAVLGGVLGSIYLILGEEVRKETSNPEFTGVVCAVAALVLAILACIIQPDMLLSAFKFWWVLLLMAIGPQLFGHSGLTYCLRYLPSSTIALGLLLEPVGAGLLAWLLFFEVPSMMDIFGAALIAVGVAIGLKDESQSK